MSDTLSYTLRVPSVLLSRVDVKAGELGISRAQAVIRACREWCDGAQSEENPPREQVADGSIPSGRVTIEDILSVGGYVQKVDIPLCGFRSYNQDDGEFYLCGKEKGHGIKHGEWVKEGR